MSAFHKIKKTQKKYSSRAFYETWNIMLHTFKYSMCFFLEKVSIRLAFILMTDIIFVI